MSSPGARVVLPGSGREAAPEVNVGTPVEGSLQLQVTVVLRRKAELPAPLVDSFPVASSAELGTLYGADPADVALVSQEVVAAGCTVDNVDEARRTMLVGGTVAALSALFGAELYVADSLAPNGSRVTHRHREGELTLPAVLSGIVVAVLGLDDRPQSRGHFHAAPAAAGASYTPLELGKLYNFPAGTDGTGTTVAVIELGGGFVQSDLDTYFKELGISGPTVKSVGVLNGANGGGTDPQGADGEVLLDLEVIGALAPKASLICYFAPNTDQGFAEAISQAAHATPAPTAISISWGGPEDKWTAQARLAMDEACQDAAALGVTVTVAAGDNGSTDGEPSGQHVDFPAASPHVLACGGTRYPAGGPETVWGGISGDGATGGGISTSYAQPAWQAGAGVPSVPHSMIPFHKSKTGRGVPDVAGDADPQTGWKVRVDGSEFVIGGTSAVAPMWAALVSRLVQALGGKPLGLLAPALYAGVKAGHVGAGFRDVTSGTNGAFKASAGWDACTGLGTPDGEALLTRLKG